MRKSYLILTACSILFLLLGCTVFGNGKNQEGTHDKEVYEAAENYVTFPYHLPYFEEYTIMDMYYGPEDDLNGIEETLFITYNADILVTENMKEKMRSQSSMEMMENEEGHPIYGPFFEEGDTILPINLAIKRTPFEVISGGKDRSELFTFKIEGKEVLYDYEIDTEAFIALEIEKEGTYYRIYKALTSNMSKEEVEEEIKEMFNAIR